MTNKCGRTRQRTNNLSDELIVCVCFFFFWGGGGGGKRGLNSASELASVYYYTRRSISVGLSGVVASLLRQVTTLCVSLRQRYRGDRHEKRKSCNHRCPDSVYFHTLLLIIYLSATETLICCRGVSLIGSTSFCFAQNTIHDFQNTGLELIVALSSTNAKKKNK